METITFQTNVKAIDFPIIEEILKRFKATDIRIIKEKKDDTERPLYEKQKNESYRRRT